jgi:predicted PurR-regulated permease PerM
VAYALDPLVEKLRNTRLFKSRNNDSRPSKAVALGMLFFVASTVLGLAGYGALIVSIQQVHAVQAHSQAYAARAQQLALHIDALLPSYGLHVRIEDALKTHLPEIEATLEQLGKSIYPAVGHALTGAAEMVIVLLISVYLIVFAPSMKKEFNEKLPPGLRPYAELWESDVTRIIGGFVRGQFIIALITGVFAALISLAIGLHAWLFIGVFAGIASLIPVFGPYIGLLPPVFAALIGPSHFSSPVVATIVVLFLFIVLNEFCSKILYPKLVGAALGLHEVVVLLVLFAGLELDGIVGVLFAAPLTALAMVTLVHLYRFWQALPDQPISMPKPDNPSR